MIENGFFDPESEKFSSFREIISKYKPLSPFGKTLFANLKALKEEALFLHFEFILKIKACEPNRARIEHVLEDFHEISLSLKAIENDIATDIDIFEIKRFIHHQRILKKLTEEFIKDFFANFEEMWLFLDPQKSGSYAFSPNNALIATLNGKHNDLQLEIKRLYDGLIKTLNEKFDLSIKEKHFVLERSKAKEVIDSGSVMIEREGMRSYTLAVRPTGKILGYENELSEIENRLKIAEEDEIKKLTSEIKPWIEQLKVEMDKISDFDLSFAQLKALKDGYVIPEFSNSFELDEAFDPIILDSVRKEDLSYTFLAGDFRKGLTLIFGPNMGGKTTVLKTLALSSALAMHGFLVPAKSAKMPIVKWIRFVGTTFENVDLSSFAFQMDKMAKALNLEGTGLILIDELGSGTNPYEGEALATAFAKFLSSSDNFVVMVTHFRGTIENIECKKYTIGCLDFNGDIDLKKLRSHIDHRLVDGAILTKGDAIKLSQALGIPKAVIDEASRLLAKNDHL